MTEPSLQEPAPRVPLPSPGPRSRPADPPLPAASPTPPPEPGPSRGLRSPFAPSEPRTDDTTGTPPDGTGSTSGDRRRRWTWRPSGDPDKVSEVIAGLLILGVGGLAALVARTGRAQLRQPTAEQADAMGAPLAGIACRHLPMGLMSDDLKDLGRFGRAVKDYLEGGPDGAPLLIRTRDLGATS